VPTPRPAAKPSPTTVTLASPTITVPTANEPLNPIPVTVASGEGSTIPSAAVIAIPDGVAFASAVITSFPKLADNAIPVKSA
jgi:hypothetical protein